MQNKPIYKLGKRLGPGVHPKCQTQKFALAEARHKKAFKHRKNLSDFNLQLLAKQRVRFSYGITEKQLVKYVKDAMKNTDRENALFRNLEFRLDNVVFMIGLAPSRRAARQMVVHGHIILNGRRNNIPSTILKKGDKVAVREQSRQKPLFSDRAKAIEKATQPAWLVYNPKKMEAEIKGIPDYDPATNEFDLKAVFEFYSR